MPGCSGPTQFTNSIWECALYLGLISFNSHTFFACFLVCNVVIENYYDRANNNKIMANNYEKAESVNEISGSSVQSAKFLCRYVQ